MLRGERPRGARAAAAVVIPAHNEAASLERGLPALLSGALPGEFEVVVVPNGCTDATAEVARAAGVRVVEVEGSSKSAALNRGDAVVSAFPRVYLDADVQLTTDALREIVTLLTREEAAIATPRRVLSLGSATLPVKLYYRLWDSLQRARGEPIGTGVYAVNRAGRARFDRFPDAVGDDTFVHRLFAPSERLVGELPVVVWPPRRLADVVAVRSRIHVGNLQGGLPPGRPGAGRVVVGLLRRPVALVGLPVYVVITAYIKILARRRHRRGDLTWSRAPRGASHVA